MKRTLSLLVIIFLLVSWLISAAGATDLIIDYQSKSYTYNEYKEFLKSTYIPEDFISFSDISHFGEMELFDYTPHYGFKYYHYFMTDKLGNDFIIYVRREYEIPEYIDRFPLLTSDQVNLADMRTLPSAENGRYVISDITYWYLSGKLNHIDWHHNGMYLSLGSSSPELAEYPLNANATIAKLLNIKYKSADKVSAIIHGNIISPWVYVAVGAVLVIIAVIVTFVIIYKKKYKDHNPYEDHNGTNFDPDFVIAHTVNDHAYDPENLPVNPN